MPSFGLMNDVNPISDPVNPHMFTLNRPVSRPPAAPPTDAVMNARPYFRLRPYMAGSVMPEKAARLADPASSLILATFDFAKTASTAPPWATIVAEMMALR